MVEQFTLRKGDVVNRAMRPAGVLIPANAGRQALIAGFNQIEGRVMRVGMVAEATCVSKPMTIIPMVVTQVQDLIASGSQKLALVSRTPLLKRQFMVARRQVWLSGALCIAGVLGTSPSTGATLTNLAQAVHLDDCRTGRTCGVDGAKQ